MCLKTSSQLATLFGEVMEPGWGKWATGDEYGTRLGEVATGDES